MEYSILGLVAFYFVILFLSEYQLLGLSEPIVEIPSWLKQVNDYVLWLIFGLLIFELALKFAKTPNPKQFLRNYWLDVAMVLLIPIFSVIKLLKLVKLAKKAKIVKSGFKVADKGHKVSK